MILFLIGAVVGLVAGYCAGLVIGTQGRAEDQKLPW